VTGNAGPVVRLVDNVLTKTANQCRSTAPADTGRLRASHRQELVVHASLLLVGRVYSTAPYAGYVNRGTGIYGPSGAPITPKAAKVLVFHAGRMIGPLRVGEKHAAPSQRDLVFAMQVKGSPANPYMIRAFKEQCPWPVTVLI
jgi:hypothetical protein